jgi:hypothetical protein
VRPLAAFGRISYGVYLFHWPLFLWMDEERTGLQGIPLVALRMAVGVALAVLSYRLIEQPVRTGFRSRPQVLLTGWANATVAVAAVLVLVTATSGTSLTTVDTANAEPKVHRADRSHAPAAAAGPDSAAAGAPTTAPPASSPTSPTTAGGGTSGGSPTTAPTSAPTAPPRPARIMVVGDSIAVNLAVGLLEVQD